MRLSVGFIRFAPETAIGVSVSVSRFRFIACASPSAAAGTSAICCR